MIIVMCDRLNENKVECFYQTKIKLYKGFDSEYISHYLECKDGLRRLIIHAPEGEFEHLLKQLTLKTNWIAFSSELTNQNLTKCKLSWLERWMLMGITEGNTLFYNVSDSLGMLRNVNESIIWRYGAGISLPVKEPGNCDIEKAIKIQIDIRRNLFKAVMFYGCVVISNRDGYGVNLIWYDEWEFAREINEWAINLAGHHKWFGEPFLI
ncbi:MAG TPA: hypothetical protein VF941_02515 [Clostridia bacterium]